MTDKDRKPITQMSAESLPLHDDSIRETPALRVQAEHIDALSRYYHLTRHPEGGSFAEVYTAPLQLDGLGRSIAGSIYFLLRGDELSHFHQIDCDEPWYYHEGCGVRITVIESDGAVRSLLLGPDFQQGENMMVVIPKGSVFAAENLAPESYTFMSCMTAPKFQYEGFRLVGKEEISALVGHENMTEALERLCLE